MSIDLAYYLLFSLYGIILGGLLISIVVAAFAAWWRS